LFEFVSSFERDLTIDEWQFAALHSSLLAAEWQAVEAYVTIDNPDVSQEFDSASGELTLLEGGAVQQRTAYTMLLETPGRLRLVGPMAALSVDLPGEVVVRPEGASVELGPDCYVRCQRISLYGETVQVVRRSTPVNGNGAHEEEASVVLEVAEAFMCDALLTGSPSTSAFEIRAPEGVRLVYPWVAYRADYTARSATPDERAVRFLNMFMNLVRHHGHRGSMGVFDKKLEGRQSVKGEELEATLGVMETHGAIRRAGSMVFLNEDWEDKRFSGKGIEGLPSLEDHMDAWGPVLEGIKRVLN
jgi:hypothetical protein